MKKSAIGSPFGVCVRGVSKTLLQNKQHRNIFANVFREEKKFLLIIICIFLTEIISANIYYVDNELTTGNNDGSSWEDAIQNLTTMNTIVDANYPEHATVYVKATDTPYRGGLLSQFSGMTNVAFAGIDIYGDATGAGTERDSSKHAKVYGSKKVNTTFTVYSGNILVADFDYDAIAKAKYLTATGYRQISGYGSTAGKIGGYYVTNYNDYGNGYQPLANAANAASVGLNQMYFNSSQKKIYINVGLSAEEVNSNNVELLDESVMEFWTNMTAYNFDLSLGVLGETNTGCSNWKVYNLNIHNNYIGGLSSGAVGDTDPANENWIINTKIHNNIGPGIGIRGMVRTWTQPALFGLIPDGLGGNYNLYRVEIYKNAGGWITPSALQWTKSDSKIYNSVFYNNGDFGIKFNHAAKSGEERSAVVKNTISRGHTADFDFNPANENLTLDADYNNAETFLHDWVEGPGTITSNPLFIDEDNNDFRLNYDSPNIDAGTDINSLVLNCPENCVDIEGNPIYGFPDIGAYEYQPPYNISSDAIEYNGTIRIYSDGKYRYLNQSSAEQKIFIIKPENDYPSHTATQKRNASYDVQLQNWTDSNIKFNVTNLSASGNVNFTICNLTASRNYVLSIDSVESGIYSSNQIGCLEFQYTGNWSEHEFELNIAEPQTPAAATEEKEQQSRSGGGIPVFSLTESTLQEGYSRQLGKDWKIAFKLNNQSHELKVNNISNTSAMITISSAPQTKALAVGEEWKVNLDGDKDYDLLVRLNNVTSVRADIYIKSINEAIEEEISGPEEIEEAGPSGDKNTLTLHLLIALAIFVLFILLIAGFFIRRKARTGAQKT